MKKTYLSPARQKQQVPVPTHSGAIAVIPPAPPYEQQRNRTFVAHEAIEILNR